MIGPVLIVIDIVLNAVSVWEFGLPTYSLAGAGLLLFIGSGFGLIKAQQDKINALIAKNAELKDTRPTIDVVAVNESLGQRMYLEVTNHGERGEFEAQIEVLDGKGCIHGIVRPTLPTYTGYWERSAGPVASLPQGHKDRLLIGRQDVEWRISLAEFVMSFFDPMSKKYAEYGTTSWGLLKDGTVAARFVLRITISCSPKVPTGPFVKTYIVAGRSNPSLTEAT